MEINNPKRFVGRRWLQAAGPWMVGVFLVAAALLLAFLGEVGADDRAGPGAEGGSTAAEAAVSSGNSAAAAMRVEGSGSFVAPATVGSAAMAVWRSEVRVSRDSPRLGLDIGWTSDHYDFSRVGRLPFGGEKPFETLQLLDAGVTLKGPLWRRTGYFVGLRGSLGFERDPGDGFGAAGMAGLSMPLGTDWAMTLGAGLSWNRVQTQPFPVVGFRYESPDLPGFSADLAFPATEIAWRMSDLVGWRLTGNIADNLYKLSDDNPAAADGYVSLFSSRVGAWLDLYPATGLSIGLGALYALPGTMTVYRESGSRLKTFDVGGAPGGAARLRYEF